jgi:hypothetical protein
VFEDGVVVCLLGKLGQSSTASATVIVRPTTAGSAVIQSNVSANQPEALTEDNSVEIRVEVGN